MNELNGKGASSELLYKDTYHITIKDNAIDKKSIDENTYLLKTISHLIKKRLVFIYIATLLYIIHVLSFIVCTYRLITDKGDSNKEFIIVFGILLGSIIMFSCCTIFCKTHYVTLFYHTDETSKQTVAVNNSAFNILSQCKKLWGVNDYAIGNYSTIRPIRRDTQLKYGRLPWYLKSNIDKCYQLSVGDKSYYFLPEKLLIESKQGTTSAYYSQIDVKIDKEAIAETGLRVPSDAVSYGYTWEHANKDGSPDKRVKNNRQIPEYLYGVIHFRSSNGTNLNLTLYGSDIRKVVDSMKILSSTNIYKDDKI